MSAPTASAMPMSEGDLVFTFMPGYEKTSENLTRFRWNMNVSLPFPFPSRKCIKQDVTLEGKPFSFEIHNHYDRIMQIIQQPPVPPLPRAFLINKWEPTPVPQQGCMGMHREQLQSVAFLDGQTDFATHAEAVAGAEQKIKAGLAYLASYLAACQRDAPYLSSWLVYPVSLFDVGTAYQEVRAYCETHKRWELHSCGRQFSMGRKLQKPTFFIDPPTLLQSESPLDTANELLAEALMSLHRGVPRLTVLNSYGAVETFANVIYAKARIAKYVADGVLEKYAEQFTEQERHRHRTEGAFLYHRGLKEACGRSLLEENKQQYDALLNLQQVRHNVAHTGYKPTFEEAQKGHRLCCEVLQWLARVGGYTVKPLLPDPADSSSTIVVSVAACSLAVPPPKAE